MLPLKPMPFFKGKQEVTPFLIFLLPTWHPASFFLLLSTTLDLRVVKSGSPGPLALRKILYYFLLLSFLYFQMKRLKYFYQVSISFEHLHVQIIAQTPVVSRFTYVSLHSNYLYSWLVRLSFLVHGHLEMPSPSLSFPFLSQLLNNINIHCYGWKWYG